jgi:hypothetical protein
VFFSCTLAELNIGENVTNIPENTFYRTNITNINAYSYTPPTVASSSFGTEVYSSANVYTLCEAAEIYRNDNVWGQFTNIHGDTTANYSITVQTENETMGSVTGAGTFTCEDEAILTATPNEGYRFLQWNDGNTDNPRTVVVTADSTFTAGFKVVYTVTVQSNNEAYGTVSGGGTYDEGSTATISATPYQGYRFVQWDDNNTDNPRTITVTDDITFTAIFEELPSYTITVLSSNEAYGSVSGGGTYYEGSTATISATPYQGYRFVRWDDDNADNPRTIIVTDDVTFTAIFEELPSYTITVLSSNEAYGSVSGGGTYYEGSTATISATPYQGYRFVSWNDDITENPRTITVTSDSTFVANFAENSSDIQAKFYADSNATAEAGSSMTILSTEDFVIYPVILNAGPDEATDTVTIDLQINGNSILASGAESISLASQPLPVNQPSTLFQDDGALAFSADEMDSYGLTGTFELCLIANYNGSDPDTSNNITCITVTRQQQYTITVLSNNEAYGSVTGGGTYDEGSEVTITATPNQGYRFVSWDDGNTDDIRTITVTSDSTFVANFEEEEQRYTITALANNEEYGAVTGGGTYNEGDTVTLMAIPYDGYCYMSWDDGNEDNPRAIIVTSDSTFIAYFSEPIHFTIDTIVQNFVTIGDHTFYSTGNYTFAIPTETGCDTIYDINLTVLAEPVYDIGPNPTEKILNIKSDGFISFVEFYSPTGQLVMRKEVNGYEAEFDVEGLVDGVYVLRIYGAESSLPSVFRIVKE